MTGRPVLVLAVLTAALYYPVVGAGLVSDDFILVGRIDLTEALRYFHESFGLGRNEYRPVTALSFAVDNGLWGDYAPGYHLTNLFLHALVGVMLCLSLHALTRDLLMSFLAAVAFLVHPINHSRVAWIAARDATVASVFLMAALWLYVLSRRDARPRLRLQAIPLAALAVLAYEGAVILPALFFSVEWLFFSTGPFIRRTLAALRPTAPFWLVAVLYVAIWQLIFAGRIGAYDLALDPLSVASNYGRLIYTLFWGHRRFLIGVAYLVLLALCFRALIARASLVLLAVAFVVISFIPYSFTEGFADRFGYLSALGFSMFIGTCLAEGLRMAGRGHRAAVACLAACLFLFNVAQVRKLLGHWNEAGALAASIPRALKRQHPELPEGAVLVFQEIPFMHGQALVYPTGLDSAIQREYPVRLDIRTVPGTSGEDLNEVGGHVLRFEYVGGEELLRRIDK